MSTPFSRTGRPQFPTLLSRASAGTRSPSRGLSLYDPAIALALALKVRGFLTRCIDPDWQGPRLPQPHPSEDIQPLRKLATLPLRGRLQDSVR